MTTPGRDNQAADNHAADFSWTAFCYVNDELAPAGREVFERQLADDQQAREALAGAVELSAALRSAFSESDCANSRFRERAANSKNQQNGSRLQETVHIELAGEVLAEERRLAMRREPAKISQKTRFWFGVSAIVAAVASVAFVAGMQFGVNAGHSRDATSTTGDTAGSRTAASGTVIVDADALDALIVLWSEADAILSAAGSSQSETGSETGSGAEVAASASTMINGAAESEGRFDWMLAALSPPFSDATHPPDNGKTPPANP